MDGKRIKQHSFYIHLQWLGITILVFGLVGMILNVSYISSKGWVPKEIDFFVHEIKIRVPENSELSPQDVVSKRRELYGFIFRITKFGHPTRKGEVPARTTVVLEPIRYKQDIVVEYDNFSQFTILPEDLNPDVLRVIQNRFGRDGDDALRQLREEYAVPNYNFSFDHYVSNPTGNPLVLADFWDGARVGVAFGVPAWGVFYAFGYWYIYRWIVQARRRQNGLCIYCKYPMQQGLCTECGYRLDGENVSVDHSMKDV